jgi:hypothetical protein
LIFDESQKEGVNQIWVDVYALVEFLQKNRSAVYKNEESGEWERVNQPGDTSRTVSSQEKVRLPVIMYHSLLYDDSRQGKYELSPDVLESDMKYLAERGYHTVTPSDLAAYIRGASLPDRPVMLTFDDGYLNNCKYLPPLLEKYGMRALVSPVARLRTAPRSSRSAAFTTPWQPGTIWPPYMTRGLWSSATTRTTCTRPAAATARCPCPANPATPIWRRCARIWGRCSAGLATSAARRPSPSSIPSAGGQRQRAGVAGTGLFNVLYLCGKSQHHLPRPGQPLADRPV